MSMTDPIADFLTRIRNAIHAAHETADIPSSKLKREMARILKEQGYIDSFEIVPPSEGQPAELIRVRLKYTDDRRSAISGLRRVSRPGARPADLTRVPRKSPDARRSAISGLRRVSRPGQRHYADSRGIRKVQGGMGTSIVSTSRGVMTGHEARQRGVGGEVVAEVW